VTESKEKALMLLHQKKITFPNYMGNDSLLAAYHIGSFPTYFLVDKDGIIQKEYTGFSSTLENDIRAMLAQ
jgi:hypothetical protein